MSIQQEAQGTQRPAADFLGLWTFESFQQCCRMGQGWFPAIERDSGGAHVGWGRVSGSHLSRMSGIYQVNSDSVLVAPCASRHHGRREGMIQGQWWLSLQLLPQSHSIHPLPLCLWCPSSYYPFPGAQSECL